MLGNNNDSNGLLCNARYLTLCAMLLAMGAGTGIAQAQFSSGSDGSDGALDYTGQSGAVEFDPSGLDVDGDGIFHFTTITIPNSVTLFVRGTAVRSPVYFLATGAVTIDGTIDASGENGGSYTAPHAPAIPGPGGFFGGTGFNSGVDGTIGYGPGGGEYVPTGIGGGGGHASAGEGNGAGFGEVYGNSFLLPMIGGSGGAGGGGNGVNSAGGGAGGGAILIASDVSIDLVSGTINASGGNGGTGTTNRYGGGGAGGAIRLLAPAITGSGTIDTRGGFSSGSNGGAGYVRIDAGVYSYSGTVWGSAKVAPLTPNTVFLPGDIAPAVQVTAVGGIPVPASPTGSFTVPDVTINDASPVTIDIAASGIPVGTAVTLHLFNDIGGNQTVTSTPLSGADDSATTATATATFPNGVSQVLVRATWTP